MREKTKWISLCLVMIFIGYAIGVSNFDSPLTFGQFIIFMGAGTLGWILGQRSD